ncbi:hypothetical protein KC19_5G142200 [Ceratodon purpureus]|uniref:Uncharacterized protein n=1 Tax=Ceratodon purpureus TaxID=3225 RepID=A0A8T0I3R8_CERPU|nr:hypothetical protein KC19_5G142200 [Ceratodon purpureus]
MLNSHLSARGPHPCLSFHRLNHSRSTKFTEFGNPDNRKFINYDMIYDENKLRCMPKEMSMGTQFRRRREGLVWDRRLSVQNPDPANNPSKQPSCASPNPFGLVPGLHQIKAVVSNCELLMSLDCPQRWQVSFEYFENSFSVER